MGQKVEYIVELTRAGNGAIQAANELKQVNAAAASVNSSTAAANTALVTFGQTTKVTTSTVKALGSAAVLLGGSEFPKLTMGAVAVNQALHAMRSANIAVTSSMTAMSAGLAGLIALVVSATYAWSAYKAEQLEAASAKALKEQTIEFTESLRLEVESLRKAGEITDATFTKLTRSLNTAGGLQDVRDFLKDLSTGTAQQDLQDMARLQALEQARLGIKGELITKEQQATLIARQNVEMQQLLTEEVEMHRMTNEEAAAAKIDAEIKYLNALKAIRAQLTEIQQLERAVAQEFASGLSAAIVQFASGAKSAEEAFKSFAATFLQQISQMIIQMIILNTLKSVGFGLAGGGQAGALRAANGAILFAANGVSGVSEVSAPTYFPKFNVIAGEAGREVMTVMARPRLMDVGGIAAQVGDVGPNRLAITNANDLQRLGSGGNSQVDVAIHLSSGLEADIIGKSANASVRLVTRKMGERGPLSENTKRLLNQ